MLFSIDLFHLPAGAVASHDQSPPSTSAEVLIADVTGISGEIPSEISRLSNLRK